MTQEIPELTKRLLACMQMGIRIEQDSGHRWLSSHRCDKYDFEGDYGDEGHNGFLMFLSEKHDIIPDCKIYGNVIDALDYIDSLLNLIGKESLLDIYGEDKWWGFNNESNNLTNFLFLVFS